MYIWVSIDWCWFIGRRAGVGHGLMENPMKGSIYSIDGFLVDFSWFFSLFISFPPA
jgi:hypothetical protein